MYTLKVKRSALKTLTKLPKGTKRQVEETLDTLKTRPIPARTNDVIKLKGVKDSFRIRIGDIRMVYTIEWSRGGYKHVGIQCKRHTTIAHRDACSS